MGQDVSAERVLLLLLYYIVLYSKYTTVTLEEASVKAYPAEDNGAPVPTQSLGQ